MSFEIPYKRTPEPERATASGPVDFEKLGEVIDGYAPDWRPVRAGEDVGHLTASLEASEALIKRMEAQLRFQHEVLAEIHELSISASGEAAGLIRTKAHVALRAAAQSGLLT
jgi:hypothetical protein